MKLVADKIDEDFYIDVILTKGDIERIANKEMISACFVDDIRIFIGVYCDELFEEKEYWWEKSED
jgi:hypothetical protein